MQAPLINCEISLDLRRSKNCVLTSKTTGQADRNADPAIIGINNSTNAEFSFTDYKLYVPVVTLSTENENRLLEQFKTEFSLTVE